MYECFKYEDIFRLKMTKIGNLDTLEEGLF